MNNRPINSTSRQSLRDKANNLLRKSGYFSRASTSSSSLSNKKEKGRTTFKKEKTNKRIKQYIEEEQSKLSFIRSI